MIKTARQLKDLIRNLSKKNAADAQILMRNYMMERFLERISLSSYRDKFYPQGRDAGGRDGRPAGPADGRRLAGGQGAGPAICDPGRGVWIKKNCSLRGCEGNSSFRAALLFYRQDIAGCW